MKKLANEIINGRRLSRDEDLSFFIYAPVQELIEGADLIRQSLCGDALSLCTIINGKSGRCSEDCKFCSQSAHYKTEVTEYEFLDNESILSEARNNEAQGVHRFSIVTAGRSLEGEDFDKALSAYRKLKEECQIDLCASHGLLNREDMLALKEAGVSRYHANIESSERYFPQVCSSHTYEDKIQVIKAAQEAGLSVCSGGIIGMGESFEDRIDMALSLSELGIDSIPLNILRPIKGTLFADLPPLSDEEILRTVAIFRYINPKAFIRMAAGRNRFADGGKILFQSGANASITGDMLTTTGTDIAGDKKMLADLGYNLNKKELDFQ